MSRCWIPAHLRALPVLALVAMLGDCSCYDHPLYDSEHNRFDTWYLGGGNTSMRPFRGGVVGEGGVLDIELALDRDADGAPLVRALVIDAIDPELVRGELTIDGARVAVFATVDGGQLVAKLPVERVRAPSLVARFDDGHEQRLEVVIPTPELRDALEHTQPTEERQP